MSDLSKPEPAPQKNEHPELWPLVIEESKEMWPEGDTCADALRQDMLDRHSFGRKKYGVGLQPFNGRNCLVDALQEALDLVVYLRQLVYESTDFPTARKYLHRALVLAYDLRQEIREYEAT